VAIGLVLPVVTAVVAVAGFRERHADDDRGENGCLAGEVLGLVIHQHVAQALDLAYRDVQFAAGRAVFMVADGQFGQRGGKACGQRCAGRQSVQAHVGGLRLHQGAELAAVLDAVVQLLVEDGLDELLFHVLEQRHEGHRLRKDQAEQHHRDRDGDTCPHPARQPTPPAVAPGSLNG
jgi:hypothetical protein